MYTGRKKLRLQGKTKAHAKQVMRSQTVELLRNFRVKTTPAKAKALRQVFDRLVTKAKAGNENYVRSFFNSNPRSIERLEYVIEEFLQDRESGYTRIVNTLPRKGDNAEQVYIMLVNTEVRERKSQLQKTLAKQKK